LLASEAYGAGTVPEYELKAAYLYNFALLTTWPTESAAPMIFCVLEHDPLSTQLALLQARKIHNRSIIVKEIVMPEEARACDVLYLDAVQHEVLLAIVDIVRNASILTVTDSLDSARTELVINMRLEASRLVFDVNMASARRAKLTFSSKLLNLAKSIN
jgi:hypothetical protein